MPIMVSLSNTQIPVQKILKRWRKEINLLSNTLSIVERRNQYERKLKLNFLFVVNLWSKWE